MREQMSTVAQMSLFHKPHQVAFLSKHNQVVFLPKPHQTDCETKVRYTCCCDNRVVLGVTSIRRIQLVTYEDCIVMIPASVTN